MIILMIIYTRNLNLEYVYNGKSLIVNEKLIVHFFPTTDASI